MMLVIHTQYQENYGAYDWDDTGECSQYWKVKGGSEFKVRGVPQGVDLYEVVELVRGDIEESSDHCRVTIIGHSLEADDYLSWSEKNQLEYEGSIQFAEPTIDYADLKNTHDRDYAEWSADLDAEHYGERV
jgi:hypothetical protein